jgi:hypothetical protein
LLQEHNLLGKTPSRIYLDDDWMHFQKKRYQFPGAVNKLAQLCGLEEKKFILLQFWKPEVRNQGVSRTEPPLKVVEDTLALPLSASGGWLHPSSGSPPSSAPTFTCPSPPGVSLTYREAVTYKQTSVGFRAHLD